MLRISQWFSALVVVALAVLGAKSYSRFRVEHTSQPQTDAVDSDGLIRITSNRIPLAEELMTLCMPPDSTYGPHASTAEVHIYANRRVLDYRRQHPNEYSYPVGSKFVKEKYPIAGCDQPDVATIMERTGTRGDMTDWAFSIVSLPNKSPVPSVGSMTCAECHAHFRDTGFVSNKSESVLKKHLEIK